MQIQSSYLSSYHSSSRKDRSAAASEEPQTGPNLEKMLENLRDDPSVGNHISENDDGTYSFDMRASGWSEKAAAAFALVAELNGSSVTLTDGAIYPSTSDMDLFKRMTGYNMLILGGALAVLDDNGFPPSAEDQNSVQQAFDFINDVACFRAAGYLEGDLTSENVGVILSAYNIKAGSSAFIDELLIELNKGSEDIIQGTRDIESNQIDELMTMVSA